MTERIVEGLIYYLVFLGSITVHEAAHAWAAKRGGDPTAYLGGQVSLSPMPHIRREPLGMVFLPILTIIISGWPFGYASAPFDPLWAQKYPLRAGWMALAGPAANLILLMLSGLLLKIGYLAGIFLVPDHVSFGHLVDVERGTPWPGIAHFLGVIFSLNLLLTIFNLIPVPPLDGSGALPLLLGENLGRKYQAFIWNNAAIGFVGIFISWKLLDLIYHPVFLAMVNLLHFQAGSYR